MALMMNLDVTSAKFSGKGTQMASRNGIATISHYLCFKSGYTEDEMRSTGLKQVVDEEKYASIQDKNCYINVSKKVFTNAGATADKSAYPQSQKIIEIRNEREQQKELEKKMNRWPGQGYEYVENVLFEKGPFSHRKGNPQDQ